MSIVYCRLGDVSSTVTAAEGTQAAKRAMTKTKASAARAVRKSRRDSLNALSRAHKAKDDAAETTKSKKGKGKSKKTQKPKNTSSFAAELTNATDRGSQCCTCGEVRTYLMPFHLRRLYVWSPDFRLYVSDTSVRARHIGLRKSGMSGHVLPILF